jgi:hypothetical protein
VGLVTHVRHTLESQAALEAIKAATGISEDAEACRYALTTLAQGDRKP